MSKGSDAFNDALHQIEKIAGKKFKAPKLTGKFAEMDKINDKFSKGVKDLHKQRDALEKVLLELQNANSEMINLLKQIDNAIPKENFGLNADDADEGKKIDQMRKIMSKGIDVYEKENDDQNSKLNELDKHLEDIGSYKSP